MRTRTPRRTAQPVPLGELIDAIMTDLLEVQRLRQTPPDRAREAREDVERWTARMVKAGDEKHLRGYGNHLRRQRAELEQRQGVMNRHGTDGGAGADVRMKTSDGSFLTGGGLTASETPQNSSDSTSAESQYHSRRGDSMAGLGTIFTGILRGRE